MAAKTISIDLQAYERLRNAPCMPDESFSKVIKRAVWPPARQTAAAMLAALYGLPVMPESRSRTPRCGTARRPGTCGSMADKSSVRHNVSHRPAARAPITARWTARRIVSWRMPLSLSCTCRPSCSASSRRDSAIRRIRCCRSVRAHHHLLPIDDRTALVYGRIVQCASAGGSTDRHERPLDRGDKRALRVCGSLPRIQPSSAV